MDAAGQSGVCGHTGEKVVQIVLKARSLGMTNYIVSSRRMLMTDPLFQVHMLNDDGKTKAADIAAAFDRLLDDLDNWCPAGREMSIVRTKLEEAAFFAKKAMANQPENQDLKVVR
jgi:hypothetical protein